MNIISNPQRSDWDALLKRPAFDSRSLESVVLPVLNAVKENGDKALLEFTTRFDKVALTEMQVMPGETEEAESLLGDDLKAAIIQAKQNIHLFHSRQLQSPEKVETMPGVTCWRKSVGIEKVGLYIPGGSAPLFSTVLMLGIPAAIAGCREIILTTPPGREGRIHPAILFAAQQAGITRIFKAGGAQAIAAMAYGTESIPAVFKIFGPGNQYVTCAKQLVQRDGVAIDMPAGPSEVCVLADETANSGYIAADLLSQAEHGPDSQVLLVTTSAKLAPEVMKAIETQTLALPRKQIVEGALQHSKVIIVKDIQEAVAIVNAYAPEHLIISCVNDEAVAEKIVNAGSVFLGNYSPESAGDYASGTNHTLPTNGYARAYSGVSVDSFVKKITYQKLTRGGLSGIAPVIIRMAEAEGLEAHANAVRVRMGK
ncbi:MAG: histidinol dehydrogenase [Sphingobacteriales bacterium]|nr:histidinol dehydrogenase [Sphingobacteriales bacterium]OJY90295.1 MAG: histidinol dehydrogenase [Sphingobacteriales bacterium 44-15]